MDLYTPLQLLPAEPGWLAVYSDDKTGELFLDKVLCWAVADVWISTGQEMPVDWRPMRGPHARAVVGIVMTDTGPDVAEHTSNLLGYMREGESPQEQPWFTARQSTEVTAP